jgi:glycosyltransferase involved in cell wall biosynthesis
VLVVQQGGGGGMGRYELLLRRSLRPRSGFEPLVRTISRTAPQRPGVRAAGRVGAVDRPGPVRFTARVLWEVQRQRPDVILYTHLHLARLQPLVRRLRPRTTALVVAHGHEVWEPLSWARRNALGTCDAILTPSGFVARRMDAANGQDHAPVVVVGAALSDDWTRGVVPRREPTGGGAVLAVAGLEMLDRDKGVDRVVEAFPQVLEKLPTAVLRIAGDGSDRARLQGLTRSLGIDERVRFLGTVDEATLKRLYASSDLLALPSTQEGFGLVYLEAMAHGLPAVVAAGTAASEVVEPGLTGIAVDPDDLRELADAMVHLLTDHELWRRTGRAARAAFEARWTEEAFAERLRAALLAAG